MISRLRQAAGSPFVQAVAVLSSGQTSAMILPILAAPLLGRLYLPSDYGALAQYMAPAAVLAVLASLQFQHAVIAERTDRRAGQVAWLTILAALVGSALAAIAFIGLWKPLLSDTNVGVWYALLPFNVAGAGVIAAGSMLAIRHRLYVLISKLQIIHVATTVILSIVFGFLELGADGLLASYFVGQVFQIGVYSWFLCDRGSGFSRWPGWTRLLPLARRHWKFPAFTLPSEFSGQLNQQVPVFALSAVGAEATLGAFTRARQLASMPATMFGSSVAQVFLREGSEHFHETGSCRELMLRTAGWLLAGGIGPCLAFMALAPWLFVVYLGPDWREAGEIARILAPMLLLRVVVSPVSTVLHFTSSQRTELALSAFSTLVVISSMGSVVLLDMDDISIPTMFAVSFSICYAVTFVACVIVSKKE